MTKLYELTSELKGLQQLAYDLDADNTDATMMQAIEDTMEGLNLEFNDKAVAIVKVAENLNADTSALDAEIKRLQERKKVITNRQESLKDYLRFNMDANGVKKIECPLFSITLGKGSPTVQIIDDSTIPDDYMTVKTEIKPDKAAIVKALKSGIEVNGASLIEGKPRLMIR